MESKSTLPDISTLVQITWNELSVGDLIGEGGYGTVHRGKWQGIDIAIKQLHLKKLPVQLLEDFKQEVSLMSKCRFPFVIELYGVCLEVNNYSMVMPYLTKGSLYEVIHDPNEIFPWNPLRWNIGIEVGKGLSYLHHQSIIHRDLKSLNILLDNQYHVKITDFGMAKLKLESTSTSTKARHGMGTTRWRAPELFKRGAKPNTASDVYGYGMVLWEIASRKLPFEDAPDEQMVISFIKDGEKENIPTDCPAAFAAEIEHSWLPPDKRPLAIDISNSLEKAKPLFMEEKPVKSVKPVKPKPSSPERSWHFDPTLKKTAVMDGKPYVLIPASQKDFDKVVSFYVPHPINGYEIGKVEVIYNPAFNRKFTLHMETTLQERDNNPGFVPTWPQMSYPNQRQGIMTLFNNLTQPHFDPDYPALKLLPAWHGTRKSLLDSIFRTGYSNLSTTDDGYFGKGLYTTYEAEYAYRVYSKHHGSESVLILNWVASFSSLPVVYEDMPKLRGKGNYGNFDAHFVPIVPQNPHNPNETIYFPCKEGQPHEYTEMVVFESSACLPRYVVTLQKVILKSPSSTPQPIHIQNKSVKEDVRALHEKWSLLVGGSSDDSNWLVKETTIHLQNFPNSFIAFYYRGRANRILCGFKIVDKSDWNEALNLAMKKKEESPNDVDAHFVIAQFYHYTDEYDKSIQYSSMAIQLNPNYSYAYWSRGNSYHMIGEYDKCIEDCSKSIQLNPNYSQAYGTRGASYRMKDDLYYKCIEDCSKAIQLNPNDSDAYCSRGVSYRMKGEYDKCIEDCSKAIQLNPNYSDAYFSRGESYQRKDEYDKCIEDCSKSIQLNPNYSVAYWSRGASYRMKGEYDKCIEDCSKAIQLNPNYSVFYGTRGSAYHSMGNAKAAKLDLEKALKLDPNYLFAKNELNKLKE